ncbi:hypothetical protein HDV00_005816 [Rhizophlyctis rosea]|nr:hypothetical protein HDV00_005816 [Rhizophlyctis rosea]
MPYYRDQQPPPHRRPSYPSSGRYDPPHGASLPPYGAPLAGQPPANNNNDRSNQSQSRLGNWESYRDADLGVTFTRPRSVAGADGGGLNGANGARDGPGGGPNGSGEGWGGGGRDESGGGRNGEPGGGWSGAGPERGMGRDHPRAGNDDGVGGKFGGGGFDRSGRNSDFDRGGGRGWDRERDYRDRDQERRGDTYYGNANRDRGGGDRYPATNGPPRDEGPSRSFKSEPNHDRDEWDREPQPQHRPDSRYSSNSRRGPTPSHDDPPPQAQRSNPAPDPHMHPSRQALFSRDSPAPDPHMHPSRQSLISRDSPAPMDISPPDDSFHIVQRYFGLLKKAVLFTYDTTSVPKWPGSTKMQDAFVASAEMPLPDGVAPPGESGIVVEAQGLSKKEARGRVIEMIRERIDAEGLIGKAMGEKKRGVKEGGRGRGRGGAGGGRGGRGGASGGGGRGRGKKGMDAWEADVKAITLDRGEESKVPSAWDDDDDVPPAKGEPAPTRGNTNRMNSPMSLDDGYDGLKSAWDAGVWGGSAGGGGGGSSNSRLDVRDHRFTNGSGPSSSSSWSQDLRPPTSRDKRRYPDHDTYHDTSKHPRDHRSDPFHAHSPPPPNATLPPNIDDVDRKFVHFYCARMKIPVPVPVYQHLKPRPRESSGKWVARLHLAPHMYDGVQISHMEGVGLGKNKKETAPRAWHNLSGHLLGVVSEGFVDGFKIFVTPFKERLRMMLEKPVKVDVVEGVVARLGKLVEEMESLDAFRISDAGRSGNVVEGDLVLGGAGGGWDARERERGRDVREEDVEVPEGVGRGAAGELPVVTKFREIIAAMESSSVVVLSAETGAGKTTQVPQFILAWEKWKEGHPEWERRVGGGEGRRRSGPASVIITQPRRIAAISVAQRVAYERGESVGGGGRCAVGYQVRFEQKMPNVGRDEGRMVFCTSGILLRRFQDDPMLTGVTHIILDEVHERDLNTDLLLIIIRTLLHRRPDIKLILMSATAETELFQSYFKGFGSLGRDRLPPIVSVPGRLFPVKENHLEDVMDIIDRYGVGGDPRSGRKGILPRWVPETQKYLRTELEGGGGYVSSHHHGRGDRETDYIPLDTIEALIAHIALTHPPGAILVFLPGWQEINLVMGKLQEDRFGVGFGDERRARVLPLHSSVPMAGQGEVFKNFGEGVRKVVLSTNIAETSVTINDVVYVIDSGRMRQNSYDADRRISSLASVWGSQSNIKQRIGRAGRCQPGLYYSLMSRRRRRALPYSMPPELLRVDLQSTVLKIKALRLAKSSREVFAAAPEPPSPGNVHLAIQALRSLGALDDDEGLTPLGKVLSELPVDPWIGKMVLEGAALGVLDPIVTIAGGMEVGRGIYAIHPDEKIKARDWILKRFAKGTESDQLTMWKAFEGWRGEEESGGVGAGREFCARNWLHGASLVNVEKARKQFLRVLEDCGVVRRSYGGGRGASSLLGGEEYNVNSGEMDMIRGVLCGALYPNVAEVLGKDEYRGKTDWKLRLTGSSVNSWSGVSRISGVEPPVAATGPAGGGMGVGSSRSATPDTGYGSGRGPGGLTRYGSSSNFSTTDTMSVASDFDTDLDDVASVAGSQSGADDFTAPLPARLLCYQDKQQVDGGVYMRHTTRADAIGLVLFANFRDVRWSRDVEGEPGVVLDGWLRIQMGDERRQEVVMAVREWIGRYLEWVVWRRAGGGGERERERKIRGGEEEGVLGGVYGGDGEGEEVVLGSAERSVGRREEEERWEALGRRLVKEVAVLVGAACEKEREAML